MSKYIHHIIRYFFRHDVPEEITRRVHQRLLLAQDNADEDNALRKIWDSLDGCTMDNDKIEMAYHNVASSLFGNEKRQTARHWLRMAAIWLVPILLFSASLYLYVSSTRNANEQADVAYVQKFTAEGERELVVLPDCTKVWLNGGSVLIYPSRFVSSERNVCLSGEAYFDVTKDAAKPFIVSLNSLKLRVVGTTFNVSSYPDEPEITATLDTGKVQVDVEGKSESYILNPNDRLVYNHQTGKVDISKVNAENYSSWRSGGLYFDNTPFAEVARELERAYGVDIHVMNSKYNTQTIRAHFGPNEPIKNVLDIVKMLVPGLVYDINGKDIYIK